MAKADSVPTWNKTDNTKLAELFKKGLGRRGISTQDTTVNTANRVLGSAGTHSVEVSVELVVTS